VRGRGSAGCWGCGAGELGWRIFVSGILAAHTARSIEDAIDAAIRGGGMHVELDLADAASSTQMIWCASSTCTIEPNADAPRSR
jgi:hypothetical protein